MSIFPLPEKFQNRDSSMCNIVGLVSYIPPKKEYLQFKCVKDRKNFIKDMATIRIAISMLDVSLQGDTFNGEIKTFHINKDRKEIKKANEYLSSLKNMFYKIHSDMTQKDINTAIHVSENIFKEMVKISVDYSNISLAHVALYLTILKLNRKNAFVLLEPIKRTWGIKRVIRIFEENGITTNGKEEEMAKKLLEKIESSYK